ncbi:hypothetical protein C0J52_19963 [Blattella germanica]|nr:hypothetical protein C0J52_19963 [Blattella germanica]
MEDKFTRFTEVVVRAAPKASSKEVASKCTPEPARAISATTGTDFQPTAGDQEDPVAPEVPAEVPEEVPGTPDLKEFSSFQGKPLRRLQFRAFFRPYSSVLQLS